jgi:putative SOS response-associated peptidase YedK
VKPEFKPRYFTEKEMAEIRHVGKRDLPPYVKFGHRVLYPAEQFYEWEKKTLKLVRAVS